MEPITFLLVFLICAVLLYVAMFEAHRTGTCLNLCTVFCSVWCFSVFLTSLGQYGMIEIRIESYFIVFLGAIGYITGWYYCIATFFRGHKSRIVTPAESQGSLVTSTKKTIYIIIAVDIIFYGYSSFTVLKELLQGSTYVMIRNMYQGYGTERMYEGLVSILNSLVFSPSISAIFIVTVIDGFRSGFNKKMFVLSTIALALYTFSSASRGILLVCMVTFAVGATVYRYRFTPQQLSWVKRVLAFIVLILGLITLMRGFSEQSGIGKVIKNVYMYFGSSIPMMQEKIQNSQVSSIQTNGAMFFYGLLDLLDSLLKYIFHIEWDILEKASMVVADTEKFIKIYSTNQFNAFVSSFYYLYKDFGMFSVILGNFAFGFISAIVSERLRTDHVLSVCIYIYLLFQTVFTLVRWPFAYLSQILVYIYLFLFLKKRRKS